MRRLLPTALLWILALTSSAAAPQQLPLRALVGATFTAYVVSVADDDTLDVRRTGTNTRRRIRLDGVDAPEAGEPFSNVARTRTRVLAFDKSASSAATSTNTTAWPPSRRRRFGELGRSLGGGQSPA